jgi:cobalt/nickel transport system permease protein
MTLAFDALEAPHSAFARLDPRWKLAALLPAILATALLQTLPMVGFVFAFSVLLLICARLPRRFLVSRLAALALFLAPFVIVLALLEGQEGLTAAIRVAGKASAMFLFGLLLTATAPFSRTVQAAQALGLPRLVARVMLLSYRYVYVLADEFFRLRTALRVRGFRNRASRHSYRVVGNVAGTMFVRGADRAEHVAWAMRSRGFDGRCKSLGEFATHRADVLFLTVACSVVGSALVCDIWMRS